MRLVEWPSPEDFGRRFCRRIRTRWAIHPYRITERAGLLPVEFMAWESGKDDGQPLGFRLLVYAALRQLVAEHALATLTHLVDVEPYARRRLEHDAVVRGITGRARRHPRDNRLPSPPVPASPAALGWLPK